MILFSPGFGNNVLQRVAAAGGVPTDVTKAKTNYIFPVFLPDGRRFLYVTAGQTPEKNGVYLGSLDGKESRRVLADVSGAASSQLLFLRENNLMAQPFDAGSAQVSGDVFPVAEGVSRARNNSAPVTVSENGSAPRRLAARRV